MNDDQPFGESHALVVGINDYRGGIPSLQNARADATALASLLRDAHGYRVELVVEDVTRARLVKELDGLAAKVAEDDRLLFYFAGHGIAPEDEAGIRGYLIPSDAKKVADADSLLSMDLLQEKLLALPCRHALVVLDCCYAGAFRWASTRHAHLLPATVYSEHYLRYVRDPAWQVLTSTSHDQRALDGPFGRLGRRQEGQHSPFAQALLEGLEGEADWLPPDGDGLITVGELAEYLRHRVELETLEARRRQTPGLFSLERHDKGQYVFEVPGREMDLRPAPVLEKDTNPYFGLSPFQEADEELFFGRDKLLEELSAHVEKHTLSVLVGASGTGKSSLVRAGLVAQLRGDSSWRIVGPMRPTARPMEALAVALREAGLGPPVGVKLSVDELVSCFEGPVLLIVDQLEELVSLADGDGQDDLELLEILSQLLKSGRDDLRILLTLRSDFEPHFASLENALGEAWGTGRLVVSPFTHEELRQAILGPASRRVLFFEDGLVERLVEEVLLEPGGLPLLSFTLRQLYERYIESERTDRCLSHTELDDLGGVGGAVRQSAEQIVASLEAEDPEALATLRRVMLRMVALRGGEPTRRQVPMDELKFSDPSENARVKRVLGRLEAARLVVPDVDPAGKPFVEPAHDRLITAWPRLRVWLDEDDVDLPLLRWITGVSADWDARGRPGDLLTPNDPRIQTLRGFASETPLRHNAREAAFITDSHEAKLSAQREREVRRRWIWGSVIAILSVALLTALGWIDLQNRSAAQNLALIGRGLMDTANQRQRGLQVAASSMALRPGAQARLAVYRGIGTLLPALSKFSHHDLTEVSEAVFSPDGRWIATGGFSHHLQLTEADTGRVFASIDIGTRIRGLAFHPDGRVIAVACHAGLELWALEAAESEVAMRRVAQVGFEEWTYSVRFADEGRALIVGGADGVLRRFSTAEAGQEGWEPTLQVDTGRGIFKVAATVAGDVLVVGTQGLAKLYAADSFQEVISMDLGDRRSIPALAISPNGQVAATGDFTGRLRVWDLQQARVLRQTSMDELIHDVKFSADGQLIAAGGQDRTARVWRVDTLELVGSVVHESMVKTVAFLPRSPDQLLTSGSDGWVRTWQVRRDAEHLLVPGSRMALSLDGTRMAVASRNHLTVLDTATGATVLAVETEKDYWHLMWSGDGTRLLAWQTSYVDVYERRDGVLPPEPVRVLSHRSDQDKLGRISALVAGPETHQVTFGTHRGSVGVWDLETGEALVLVGHTGRILSLGADRENQIVTAVAKDGRTLVWNLGTEQEIGRLEVGDEIKSAACHRGSVFVHFRKSQGSCLCSVSGTSTPGPGAARRRVGSCESSGFLSCRSLDLGLGGQRLAAFSPQGNILALTRLAEEGEHPVELRNGRNGKLLFTLNHSDTVESVAFSSDGQFLATAGSDRHARIWRVFSGEEEAPIPHPEQVWAVAWAGEGDRYLATDSEDDQIRLWPWSQEDLLREACDRLTIDMDAAERQRIGKVLSLAELCGQEREAS